MQAQKAELNAAELEASLRSMSADIVVRQQEAEVAAWQDRVGSLLRLHDLSTRTIPASLANTDQHELEESKADEQELTDARKQETSLRQSIQKLTEESASTPGREDVKLLLRQQVLQDQLDDLLTRIAELEVCCFVCMEISQNYR